MVVYVSLRCAVQTAELAERRAHFHSNMRQQLFKNDEDKALVDWILVGLPCIAQKHGLLVAIAARSAWIAYIQSMLVSARAHMHVCAHA